MASSGVLSWGEPRPRRKPTIGAVSSRLLSDPPLLNIEQPTPTFLSQHCPCFVIVDAQLQIAPFGPCLPPCLSRTDLPHSEGSIWHFSRHHYVSLVQSQGPINLLVRGEHFHSRRQPAGCHSPTAPIAPAVTQYSQSLEVFESEGFPAARVFTSSHPLLMHLMHPDCDPMTLLYWNIV